MQNLIFFLFFYALLYLLGRGILISIGSLFKRKDILDLHISAFPISTLNPIFALFYIGQLVLILNFFTKGVSELTFFLVLIPFLFNYKRPIKFKKLSYENLRIFAILSILSVSSNGITFHQDAANYQLNNQHYIRSEKIVAGLANLYSRYGFSSLSEYINSFFWLDNNFIFLHFVNLTFISIFYIFLSWCIFSSDNFNFKLAAIFITLYGLLDNIGINGGRNGFIEIDTIGKQDNIFAVLFFICNFFIIYKISNNLDINKEEFVFIYFLILYSSEIRIFGLVSLVGLFYISYNKIKLFLNKSSLAIFFLGFVWILKNFIVSSCLIFPITRTCFQSPWGNIKVSEFQAAELRQFHLSYNIFDETIIDWLLRWNERYLNYYVGLNLLFSLLFLFFIINLFFKLNRNTFAHSAKSTLYIFTLIIFWLISAPSIRFGIGVFLIVITSVAFMYKELRIKSFKILFNNKHLLTSLLLTSVFFTPLFDNYFKFKNELRVISIPQIEYVKKDNSWGVQVYREVKFDGEKHFCWINKFCTPPFPEGNIIEKKLNNYRVFISK